MTHVIASIEGLRATSTVALLCFAYAGMSAITFLAYGLDKWAAVHDRWRVSERALHVMSLLGGGPGALLAQRVFRHKTLKQPFRRVFWITVVANVAAVVLLVAWGIPRVR